MNVFRLVLGDFERALHLNFDEYTEDRLVDLLRQADDGSREQDRLIRLIVEALSPLAEELTERPTDNQLNYANGICSYLGIVLPDSAKTDIREMRKFLTEFAPIYRRKKGEEKRVRSSWKGPSGASI